MNEFDGDEIAAMLSFQLRRNRLGYHGLLHWFNVHQNGVDIARSMSYSGLQADTHVIFLFSIFHDAGRVNENNDPDHGRRGAALAHELREQLQCSDNQFDLLIEACVGHTDGTTHTNPTIGACWDADRLDLFRVGMFPEKRYFSFPEHSVLGNVFIAAKHRADELIDVVTACAADAVIHKAKQLGITE